MKNHSLLLIIFVEFSIKYLTLTFVFCALLSSVITGCSRGAATQNQVTEQFDVGYKVTTLPFDPSEALLSFERKASGPNSASNTQQRTPANAPRKTAVVVAVNDYMREKALRFTKNDAYRLCIELFRIDFDDIIILTCPKKGDEPEVESGNLATHDRIEEVIQAVLGQAKEGDLVMIFMTGHGLELDGQPYFMALNSRGDSVAALKATTVSINGILESFGNSKATTKLMMIDACRNNPVPAGSRGGVAPLKLLAKSPEGVALLQSCGSGEFSIEGGLGPYGLFANALVEGLQGKAADGDGNITLLSLAQYVMKRTREDAAKIIDKDTKQPHKQTPYMSGNFTDFVLVPAGWVRPAIDGATQTGQTAQPTTPVAPPVDPEALKEARATIDAAIKRLIETELNKVKEGNKNPDVNPFDKSGLELEIAATIADKIKGSRSLEIVLSQATAKYELEALLQELLADPIQVAVKVEREKWDADLAERKAKVEQERQEAIAEQQRIKEHKQQLDAWVVGEVAKMAQQGTVFNFEPLPENDPSYSPETREAVAIVNKICTVRKSGPLSHDNVQNWIDAGFTATPDGQGGYVYSLRIKDPNNPSGPAIVKNLSDYPGLNVAGDVFGADKAVVDKLEPYIEIGMSPARYMKALGKLEASGMMDGRCYADILFGNRDEKTKMGALLDIHNIIYGKYAATTNGSFDVRKINTSEFADIIKVMKFQHENMRYDKDSLNSTVLTAVDVI